MHEFCYEKIDFGRSRDLKASNVWTLKLSDSLHQSKKIILRRNLARVCL